MQDIIKKFKFKNNGVVFNAPTGLEREFSKLGFKTTFDKKAQTLWFLSITTKSIWTFWKGD